MAVVNMLYAGYGETPDQDQIYAQGCASTVQQGARVVVARN